MEEDDIILRRVEHKEEPEFYVWGTISTYIMTKEELHAYPFNAQQRFYGTGMKVKK